MFEALLGCLVVCCVVRPSGCLCSCRWRDALRVRCLFVGCLFLSGVSAYDRLLYVFCELRALCAGALFGRMWFVGVLCGCLLIYLCDGSLASRRICGFFVGLLGWCWLDVVLPYVV